MWSQNFRIELDMYYIIKSIVSDIHQLQGRPFNKYIRIDPPSLSGKLNIL